MCKLFCQFKFPSNKFRPLIQNTVNDVLKLNPNERPEFYASIVDLDYVGPLCCQLGISRLRLLDLTQIFEPIPREQFTNGLVLELSTFCKKEALSMDYFYLIFETLQPQICSDPCTVKTFKTSVEEVKAKFKDLNKSNYRDGRADKFTDCVFSVGTSKPRKPSASTSSSSNKSNTTSANLANVKLHAKIEERERELALLQEQVSTLGDICRERQKEVDDLTAEVVKIQALIHTKDTKNKTLKNQIDLKDEELIRVKEDLRKARGVNLYKRIKRKEKKLVKKEFSVKKANLNIKKTVDKKVNKSRQRVRSLQKKISKQKQDSVKSIESKK